MTVRRVGEDVILRIHAQPGACRSEFAGEQGGALKVRLAAPAQEGRANLELCRFLAAAFGVSRRAVLLLGGNASRHKRVRILAPAQWPAVLQQGHDTVL